MKNFLCMMVGFVAIAQIGLAATPTATVGGIKWSYTVENGKAVIGGGFFTAISTATKGEVTIPSQIAGYTVVAINDYALSECVNLTGVIIPSGIETIGEFAFYGCSSLKKVVFPKSVKTIKQYAFYECPSLENVDVSDVGDWCGVDFGNASSNPLNSSGALYCNGGLVTELVVSEGVKEIKPNAFCGCTRIKRVDIPASVEVIGLGAFKGCNSIEWIRVPFVGNKRGLVGNTNFGHIFGASSYVRNKEAVPASLKSVVVFDDSIIAEKAFGECLGIESVIISNSVVSVGNGAFYGCSGILDIELPFVGSERGDSGDPNFGYVFGTQYDSSSEVVPSTLKTVKITDETSIANCAFQGCSNITKIGLSGNVNVIGHQAFSGCTSLTEIDVSGNVKSIGYQAFSGCTSLTNVLLPNSLVGISEKAFENCISLATFNMPASVVNIGAQIFAGCVNLTAVLVVGTGGAYSSVDGVLYSADQNELVCVPLAKTLFEVPATVKKIRAYAFANLTKLEDVVIPDGVEEIGADAFYGCTALVNIEFPNSLVSIGSEALKGCRSLKRVVLPFVGSNRGCSGASKFAYIFGSNFAPTSLEEVIVTDDDAITDEAFSGCTKLKNVFIGSSVTNIGSKAFCDCRLIECLSLPFIGANENAANSYLGYFFDGSSSKNRYVPTSLREVTLMSDRLPAHAFEGCTNIERVYLIGDLLEIGESAFEGCSSLTNIQMPCGLQAIADKAFYNCSCLTKIDIPSTVERIGKCAFQGCTNVGPGIVCSSGWLLTVNGSLDPEVVIEEGVVHILDAAFAGHTEIKSVVVPHSVVSIGLGAFKGCDQIETITLPFVGGGDDSSNYWFGYIFGAESCDSNSSYVPRSLRRVEISELVALDDYAFKGCATLDTIVAQSGLVSLGAHTFDGCSYLNVFLFGNAPSVAGNSFSNSLVRFKVEYGTEGWNVDLPGQWKGCQIEYMPETLPLEDGGPYRATVDGVEWLFYVSGGEVSIGGGSASETAIRQNVGGAVIVPATLGKCPVTSISAYAFYGCGSITSVTVPESVKFIGECVLQGCNALWSVTVPFVGEQRGVVGKTQFGYLFGLNYGSHNGQYVPQGLKNVAITDDIEIANGAFYECENISSITLPFVGDKRDGDYQFIGYLFCENINKNDMLVGYGHAPECNAHVPAALSTVEILGCDRIMNKAFYGCKNLTKVVLPEGLVAIKDQAFYGCSNLRTINIPLFVREIGFDAFKECASLGEGLIIRGNWVLLVNGMCPDVVELEDGVLGIAGSAFEDCSNLKSIRLPDSLAYIGSFAFHYCTSLGHVDIPDNVSFIGSRAFGMCMALRGVKLPLKITEICDSLFSDCSNLLSVEIPDGVKSIGDYAFASCTRMTKITIPDSVESIGTCAFEACLSLSERVVNGWLLLGLDNPYIPSGTKGIAGGAFKDRNDLKNIVIPESVSYIGPCAFWGCISLTNAVIPYSVQRICGSTFKGCSGLRTIEMAEGIKEIEGRAFADCSSLKSVAVPRSVCSIGEGAFANCGGLESIVLPFVGEKRGADQYDWFGYIFGVVEWPCYYRDYSKTIPSRLKKVIITDDVAIAKYAFYNCKSIESVELSDNVETIGWWAFGDCSNLKDVVWSKELKEVGDSSFYNTSLSSIALPIGFVRINESAFQSIRVPVSITIPESVVEIGNSAFAYTTLTSVSTSRSDANRVRCLLAGSGVDLTNVEFVDENLNPIVCTVSFESQGGSSIPQKSCKFGQAIGELEEPTFTGHKFLGWYTSSVGGVQIEPNTLVWGDVTYYAHWQVNQDEFSVTFDANGGTGGVSLLVKYGSLALNVAPVVNRLGYAFVGWFTSSEGGEKVTYSTIVSADVTYYAQWEEESLEDFVISNGVLTKYIGKGGVVRIPSVVTRIGVEAFGDCTDVETLIIPAGVKSIGQYAFHWCSGIQTMIISEGVTDIEQYAFCGCSGLKSITIPSSLKVFGNDAFFRCTGLESVTISEGVTSVGKYAFAYCSKLESITIPSSVTKIGDYAFYDCSVLFVHVGSGETERVKGLYNWPSGVKFIEPAIPSVEGDSGATVTGDVETGFVIKPSAEKMTVAVAIPQGVDASKVTVEVSPKVVSVKLNGAKMKIVNGVDDITEFLDVPPANKDGVIDLAKATVKEEIVNETMDTEKGAVIKLDAVNPTLTTPNTRKGLFYQLREGVTIDGMNNGDSILGDGKPWTPMIKVKGGASAFYTISVGK